MLLTWPLRLAVAGDLRPAGCCLAAGSSGSSCWGWTAWTTRSRNECSPRASCRTWSALQAGLLQAAGDDAAVHLAGGVVLVPDRDEPRQTQYLRFPDSGSHHLRPELSSVEIRPPRRTLRLGKYRIPLGRSDVVCSARAGRSGTTWATAASSAASSACRSRSRRRSCAAYYCLRCAPRPARHAGDVLLLHHPARTRGDAPAARYIACPGPATRPRRPDRPGEPVPRRPPRAQGAVRRHGQGPRPGRPPHRRDKARLRKNEYTDWIRIPFRVAPGVKIHGLCRFLLLEAAEEFGLYVTPINIDSESPVMQISSPSVYSLYLTKRQGPFATLGLAEDTWASTNTSWATSISFGSAWMRTRSARRCSSTRWIRCARPVRRGVRRHGPHAAHVLARHRPDAPRSRRSPRPRGAKRHRGLYTGAWTPWSAGRWRSALARRRC